MDAFNDIAKWREAEALLASCDFVVAARPGFPLADVVAALPASLRPRKGRARGFAATQVRCAGVARGEHSFVDVAIAEGEEGEGDKRFLA